MDSEFRFTADMAEMAKTVAAERGIDPQQVYDAMESAIARAGKLRYGDLNVKATIDRQKGSVTLERFLEVVEEEEFTEPDKQIPLSQAQKKNKTAKVGDQVILNELPPIDFGRVAVQAAKQVIFQQVRESSRSRQYEEYKDRIGEIVNGIVRRSEFGNIVVDLGTAEALLHRNQLLGRESFQRGDRLKAYIKDVREEKYGHQIFLSRSDPKFIAGLFHQEVPEIYDGVVEVKGAVHEAGSRAKIAVYSQDSTIDPVGACVGMRGSRVQAVVNELQGEKIDIIPWSPDPATFVVNALAPVEVLKVIVDEESKSVEAVIPSEQLSLAIGRRGQNVRLASKLVDWNIDIISEEEKEEKTKQELQQSHQFLMEALNVDDVISHLLVSEGIKDADTIIKMSTEEISAIEGVNKKLAEELKIRATEWTEKHLKEMTAKLKKLKFDKELIKLLLPVMSYEQMLTLAENEITTRDDLAELASDELREILTTLRTPVADKIIMLARQHWFEEEDKNKPPKQAESAPTDAPEGEEAKTTAGNAPTPQNPPTNTPEGTQAEATPPADETTKTSAEDTQGGK